MKDYTVEVIENFRKDAERLGITNVSVVGNAMYSLLFYFDSEEDMNLYRLCGVELEKRNNWQFWVKEKVHV